MMLKKEILFFGCKGFICCDGKCEKAWGNNSRPCVIEGKNVYFLPDTSLGLAPDDSGTYEGCDGKPHNIKSDLGMNRWCARECERSVFIPIGESITESKLPLFDEKVFKYEVD